MGSPRKPWGGGRCPRPPPPFSATLLYTAQKSVKWTNSLDFCFSKQRWFHATKNILKSEEDQQMVARAMGHSDIVHLRDYVKVLEVFTQRSTFVLKMICGEDDIYF